MQYATFQKSVNNFAILHKMCLIFLFMVQFPLNSYRSCITCFSTIASGLNSLAAVVLADIIRPWKIKNPSDSTKLVGGDEDLQEVMLSKAISKCLN